MHDAVRILASPESIAGGAPNCKTGELVKVLVGSQILEHLCRVIPGYTCVPILVAIRQLCKTLQISQSCPNVTFQYLRLELYLFQVFFFFFFLRPTDYNQYQQLFRFTIFTSIILGPR